MRARSLKRVWRRKERIAQANSKAPAQERGTVLLMVIGVLALLAIIAVVYASLGQSDRRTSSALVRSVQIDDISGQVSDYLAGIIAEDTFQTISQVYIGNRPTDTKHKFLVTWTYPGIAYDDNVKSNPIGAGGMRYKPVGGGYSGDIMPGDPNPPPVHQWATSGYQPWLAPAEPTYIRYNGTDPWTDDEQQFLDFKDWLSISNVAPNGQFINLANLRDNFYAEPGIGMDDNGRPRMSNGLTLFGPTGRPYRSGFVQLVDNRSADLNIPWHWTAMQRHAARPISNFQHSSAIPGPAQDEYYPNQWADADGDGIGDSRWFEPTDLTGYGSQWSRPDLTQQDRARYFVAVRIVDLNGMVNINTATDLRNENNNAPGPILQGPPPVPGGASGPASYPFGLTPADTDLLRLLTLEDAYQRYDVGYNAFQQGGGVAGPGNYTQYTNIYPNPVAFDVGRAAYSALQWSIATDRRPQLPAPAPAGYRPNGQVPTFDPVVSEGLLTAHHETTYLERFQIFDQARADASRVGYSGFGYIDQGGGSMAGGVKTMLPFGMNELLELHAFYGVNDPRERSRLEAVMDGRLNVPPDMRPSFGPLRSSRGLELERERRGDARADGQQDDDSLAQQHLDIRHVLTTITGARPLTSISYKYERSTDDILDSNVRVDLSQFLGKNRKLSRDELMALYNHALDAIMPYRNASGMGQNPMFDPNRVGIRALNYGFSAEFAMRATAHWMANLIDSVDDDNSTDRDVRGPTCFTLRSVAPSESFDPSDAFPWPDVSIRKDSEHIELSRNGGNRPIESPRVNIYGIEAQPFLVEAATYVFLHDLSATRDGRPVLPGQTFPDDENPEPPVDPPPPVTINGDVEYQNSDFMGEVIAFQVTNPFERELYLTRAGSGAPEFIYYVEYAQRFFPLARMDQNNADQFVNENVILNPGETRVFFATSPRREFNVEERFKLINDSRRTPTAIPTNFFREWINHQFRLSTETGTTREPVHTTMFDPSTFATIAPGDVSGAGDRERGLMDLHGEELNATTDQRRVVNLWRILRTDAGVGSNPDDAGPNQTQNDLLADRIHDPSTTEATLFQRVSTTGNQDVVDSKAGPDSAFPSGGGPDPQDNTGLTMTLWGAIRRPTNPVLDNSPDRAPKGAIPPWCIEARLDQDYTWTEPPQGPNPGDIAGDPSGATGARRNLNRAEEGPQEIGNIRDFDAADATQYQDAEEMVDDQARGDGGTRINKEVRHKAENKEGNRIPPSQSPLLGGAPNTYRSFNQQAVRIALGGRDIDGAGGWNAGLYKRIADILLPLAIGPSYDPSLPAHPANPDELRRMTLAEALAVAMDYYSPPATFTAPMTKRSMFFRAGHSGDRALHTFASPTRPKLDAGHFVIDDFVPFNDTNNNEIFDPANAASVEQTLGLGIPLALNLLDKFRLDSVGGKTRSEISRVNVNTASLTALSVLPMLAPDPLSPWVVRDFPVTGDPERTAFYDPSATTHDRAATIVGYRDKIDIRTRPLIDVNSGAPTRVASTTMEVGFRDTVPNLINRWTYDGRRTRTLMPLREDRGIRSIGELLAINLRAAPPNVNTPAEIAQYQSNSMDWYARDTRSFKGQRGIEPVNIAIPGADPTNFVEGHDDLADDYGEKLAIANAAMSSVSTRSDVFCVYFLVHGYLPADVENIGGNDPLVPSIARRYMMIVDRSNVVKKGDKPRVLMFKEVPL